MILTTTDNVPGRKVRKVLGIARGSCVKARWLGKDIRAAGRTLIGGEMKYYSELLDDSRNTATERMVAQAAQMGADAVINIRYQTAAVMQSASEVFAYGTAVKLD